MYKGDINEKYPNRMQLKRPKSDQAALVVVVTLGRHKTPVVLNGFCDFGVSKYIDLVPVKSRRHDAFA